MFAPAQNLDPLRVVHGAHDRYDCPDLATLDRHIAGLRRRIVRLGHGSTTAEDHRADIDRLLDRRSWLTWPVRRTPSTR